MRTLKMILLLMTLSVMVYAQAGPGQKHKIIKMKGPHGCGGCTGAAELTEEQKAKMESLKTELQKSINPVKGELAVASAELKKLMITDNPNQSTIDKKVEEIGKLKTDMHKLKVANQLKIRKLLTDDQKVSFDKRIIDEGCSCDGSPMKKMIKIHRLDGEDGPLNMEIEEEVEELE